MSVEQAWGILRQAAGVQLGDPGYFSAPALFRTARARTVAGKVLMSAKPYLAAKHLRVSS